MAETYRVRDMMDGLKWQLSKDGQAHLMRDSRPYCNQFVTKEPAPPDAVIHPRCLSSRPKCAFCGRRLSEDYECSCYVTMAGAGGSTRVLSTSWLD